MHPIPCTYTYDGPLGKATEIGSCPFRHPSCVTLMTASRTKVVLPSFMMLILNLDEQLYFISDVWIEIREGMKIRRLCVLSAEIKTCIR